MMTFAWGLIHAVDAVALLVLLSPVVALGQLPWLLMFLVLVG